MIPIYNIIANNSDVTNNFKEVGLIRMTIRDMRGTESDSLEIVLNDIGSKAYWPKKGAEIKPSIGFKGKGLHEKGTYIVDEVKHSGPPDKIIITARAADLLKSLKVPKHRSWHKKTLGYIMGTIAAENGLSPIVSNKFSGIEIEHIDQNESDMNFITRLSKTYDAVSKPVDKRLVFIPKGEKLTATGEPMPSFTIDRSECDTHDYTEKGRSEYTGVKVGWNDRKGAKLKYEIVGTTEKIKTLRQTYATASEAKDAAQSEFKALSRDASTMTLNLKKGRPELVAEAEIPITGFRKELIKPWVAKEVTHTFDATTGISGSVQLELPNT